MPSEGRRLHGFTVISRALRLARQLILPALVGGASIGGDLAGAAVWIIAILSLPSLVMATAQWVVFRFRLDEDDLVIDSGVLVRRRRVIPLDRIQNVDLAQSALDRLAGVASLRIETASGGDETEASLTVLSLTDARAFQTDLLARRTSVRRTAAVASHAGEEGRAHEEILLRLSPLDLAVAGATANEAGLIAAGLATTLELVGRAGALERVADWLDQAFDTGAALGLVGAAGLIALVALGFLVLGWILSIVATVVRFHGFILTRAGDDLRREYGLLSRHHSTIPLERVQAVRVEETLLRRVFGLAALKVETAGSGPGDQGGGGAGTYVPITRRSGVGPLLREVFQDARFDGVPLESVAPASRRRELVRIEAGLLLTTAALAALFDLRFLAILVLAVPGWFLATARYRARGWARAEGYVIARDGVLTRTTWVVPERKVQTLHVHETPFQRRWALATLIIDTAGGGRDARVIDLHRTTAASLLQALAARSRVRNDGTFPAP